MKPLISIIIPVYNHAHCLERCFFSLFRQTYRPLEVIVVNDGSTDNFEETMISLLKLSWIENLSIKIIDQKNLGANAARNRGFAASSGEYVIFWDADTIARPEMLAKMLAALESHPEASYAYSHYRFGWKKIKSKPFDAGSLKLNNYIDTTSLIRRAAVLPFDEGLKRFQDWDLWLTMFEEGKVGQFVPEVLYRKIVGLRKGYSSWLPSFFYRLPWKIRAVREFEVARQVILRKHQKQGLEEVLGR